MPAFHRIASHPIASHSYQAKQSVTKHEQRTPYHRARRGHASAFLGAAGGRARNARRRVAREARALLEQRVQPLAARADASEGRAARQGERRDARVPVNGECALRRRRRLRHGRSRFQAGHRYRFQRATFGHRRRLAELEEARAAIALVRGRCAAHGRPARSSSRAQPFRALP